MITKNEEHYTISIPLSRDFPESVELVENTDPTAGKTVIRLEIFKDRWRSPKDTVFLLEQIALELKEKYQV